MIFAVVADIGYGEDYRKLCFGLFQDMKSAQQTAEKVPGSVILAERWDYEPVGELSIPMDLTKQRIEEDEKDDCCPHCGREWD